MTEGRAPRDEERFFPEAATPAWRLRLKATEPGRLLAAVYRRRRLPKQILRAPGGLRRGAMPVPAVRRRVKLVCWIAAGPGEQERLLDTWAAAAASSPGEVALLVTDDWTPDCHAAAIVAQVPDAVVVRTSVPTGGPPRLWPAAALALETALAQFDFELLVKLDADALVVGPDWAGSIAAAITAREGEDERELPVGIAGAFRERPDGGRELDEPYHQRVLAGEIAHDARLADWVRRARAVGWPHGAIVQGGCMVLTRTCVEAIAAEGALAYRPRLRTIVSEDLLLTVLAYATGHSAASLGGPDGPLAIATKHLPLPLDELLDHASPWRVTHSTKVGLDGEPEAQLRAAAKRARASWPTAGN